VFFQANIVVETNYTLQQFQGRIGADDAPTAIKASGSNAPPPNVFTTAKPAGVNMGGCMGCHGNAKVSAGSDFSFILKEGKFDAPETPSALEGSEGVALRAKYLDIFRR